MRAPMQRHQGGYYVRMTVFDRPGAAASIVTRMAEADISLESIVQRRPEGGVPVRYAGQVSGVLFTADPTTGRRDVAVVSATWGLGEGLVSGALAADGFTALKAEPLAKAMGVSRGSFYWHFKDRAELHAAMLVQWLAIATREIIVRVEAGGGPAALWECVNVLWDHTAQAAWPISDAVRADLQRYAGEPAQMRR